MTRALLPNGGATCPTRVFPGRASGAGPESKNADARAILAPDESAVQVSRSVVVLDPGLGCAAPG
jgi:hypothetical protein